MMMGKGSKGGERLRVWLLTVGAVLLLAVAVGTIVQQCDAVEISSSTEKSRLKSEEHHTKLQDADGCGAEDDDDDNGMCLPPSMDADGKKKAVDVVKEAKEDDEFEEEFEFEEFDVESHGDADEDEDEEEGDDDDVEEEGKDEDDEEGSDFEGEDFDDESEGEEEQLGAGEEPEDNVFDETDVVVLGGTNFSSFVNSNHYVMVEFYAPWCGHCKSLAPEYAEAATLLKGQAALAKVDATGHDPLAREYSVDSYPTLFFFIDGVHRKYPGHNKRDEIVDWVKKKTSLTVAKLLSKADAELILDSQKSPLAIALLSSLEGPEVEEFTSAARQEDDVQFYVTNSAEVAKVFDIPSDIKRPAVVLLKKLAEMVSWFDGTFQRDAISAFVSKHKLPLIVIFSKENAPKIFESSIKKQVILFAGQDDLKELKTSFMEASKALLGKLIFVHVDLDDEEQARGIIDFFGLKGDQPAVMGYETQDNKRKFLLDADITTQNVKAFGEDFLSDILKAHLKSEPLPETNDEDVKIVVGKNLDDIVLDESKDAFLEIYMPGCGHCDALEPIWNKLARRLRSVESIVIAKMDGTANEHDRAKPDGYPTLLFFPAGKKSFDPITFEGDRTLKDFVKFLKKEAAIPFTVPKKPENSPAAELTTESAEQHISEAESSSSKSPEPELESVIEDSWSSRKDEL
ncbi:unnamed protein product [Calypogeia fissa]